MPLRALQGFIKSIRKLIKVNLHPPHYSLAASMISKLSARKPLEIAIDSSGLKVTGEGEWKVKIHGADKRRNWIKIYIGVDTRRQEFLHHRGIQDCMPPRKNGKVKGTPQIKERNFVIEVGALVGGDKEGINLWKSISEYHRKSLIETVFSRLKRIFGDMVKSKKFDNISLETIFHCYVLNRMNHT